MTWAIATSIKNGRRELKESFWSKFIINWLECFLTDKSNKYWRIGSLGCNSGS